MTSVKAGLTLLSLAVAFGSTASERFPLYRVGSVNSTGGITEERAREIAQEEARAAAAPKQDQLVSGQNIKTINNQSILGSGNINIQGGGSSVVESGEHPGYAANADSALTADSAPSVLSAAKSYTDGGLSLKQDNLISGTTIKTVNGQTLLGSGDIEISGGGSLPEHLPISMMTNANGAALVDLKETRIRVDEDEQSNTSAGDIVIDFAEGLGPSSFKICAVAYGNGTYVAGGPSSPVLTSDNGRDWTYDPDAPVGFEYIVYGAGFFLAKSASGGIYKLETGKLWKYQSDLDCSGFVSRGSEILGIRNSLEVWATDNGYSWMKRSTVPASSGYIVRLIYAGNKLFAAVYPNDLYSASATGTSWVKCDTPSDRGFYNSVAYDGTAFFTVPTQGSIYSSLDGIYWSELCAAPHNSTLYLSFLNGTFLASDWYGKLYASDNFGLTWIESNLPETLPAEYKLMNMKVLQNKIFLFLDPKYTGYEGKGLLVSAGTMRTVVPVVQQIKVNGVPVTADENNSVDLQISGGGIDETRVTNIARTVVSESCDASLTQNGNPADAGAVGTRFGSYVPVTRRINGHELSSDVTISIPDISNLVPNTRKINGQQLSSDVTISVPDISNLVPNTRKINGKFLSSDVELYFGYSNITASASNTVVFKPSSCTTVTLESAGSVSYSANRPDDLNIMVDCMARITNPRAEEVRAEFSDHYDLLDVDALKIPAGTTVYVTLTWTGSYWLVTRNDVVYTNE